MTNDFDAIIERHGTNSVKWDFIEKFFATGDLLPMWVADMDFRSPEPVIQALRKVADFGIFGYGGVPQSYCEAIVDWMKRRHGWAIKDDWIVYSPGVVPALHMLVTAFTEPGDQVVLQPPVYFPFFNAVTCSGREVLENHLILEDGKYTMDLQDLARKITSRTRMIILCSPQNPISRVWKREELEALGMLCHENNILVVSDEIHEDLVYAGFKHVPFASVSDPFSDNSVTCTAASKTFNLPGLQTSNIVIPDPVKRKRFKEVVRNSGFQSPNVFGTAATEAAYRFGEPWLTQLLAYLEGNVAFLLDYVHHRIPGLRLAEPQGTYLLWLDFRDCGIDPARLANFIRDEAKVGLEPGKIFGCRENGFERMNIACPRATLEEALRRIEKAVAHLAHN